MTWFLRKSVFDVRIDVLFSLKTVLSFKEVKKFTGFLARFSAWRASPQTVQPPGVLRKAAHRLTTHNFPARVRRGSTRWSGSLSISGCYGRVWPRKFRGRNVRRRTAVACARRTASAWAAARPSRRAITHRVHRRRGFVTTWYVRPWTAGLVGVGTENAGSRPFDLVKDFNFFFDRFTRTIAVHLCRNIIRIAPKHICLWIVTFFFFFLLILFYAVMIKIKMNIIFFTWTMNYLFIQNEFVLWCSFISVKMAILFEVFQNTHINPLCG